MDKEKLKTDFINWYNKNKATKREEDDNKSEINKGNSNTNIKKDKSQNENVSEITESRPESESKPDKNTEILKPGEDVLIKSDDVSDTDIVRNQDNVATEMGELINKYIQAGISVDDILIIFESFKIELIVTKVMSMINNNDKEQSDE